MIFRQLSELKDSVDLNYRVPLDVSNDRQASLLDTTFRFVVDATNELVESVLQSSPYGDYGKELAAQSNYFTGDALVYADMVVAEELYRLYPTWQAMYPDAYLIPFLDGIRKRAYYILARRGRQILQGYDVSEDDLLSKGYSKNMNYIILAMPPLDYDYEECRFVVPTISDKDDIYSKPVFYEKYNPLPPLHDFMGMLRVLVSAQRHFDYEYFRLYRSNNAWYLSYKITPSVVRRFLDVGHYVILRDRFCLSVLRRLAGALVSVSARRKKFEVDPLAEAMPSAGEMRMGKSPHRFRRDLEEVKVESGYSYIDSVRGVSDEFAEVEDDDDGFDSQD